VAVPAAGSGSRLGGLRKPFLELAGEPVLAHALRPFLAHPSVVAVVVALAPEDVPSAPAWITDLDARISLVAGGRTRADSVGRAIAALPVELDVIAVHDAARPLVTEALIAECIRIASLGQGAVAGCPAVDTIKEVDEGGRISGTLDRSRLWRAHTPQAFPAALLRQAYSGADPAVTDDAGLVERLGADVRMVDGGAWNLKVTRPEDVPVAEALLRLAGAGNP
jgi:2-C-methyl-D-erythritol 4-phosphate cytidylyltransferase